MKKIIQLFGLITLICFSFFYTEKVVTIMQEVDPIMIQIQDKYHNSRIITKNAIIENDTIIPGISGSEIDIEASYSKMKKYGSYQDKFLVYRRIFPSVTIDKIYDKFIIQGNSNNNNVSLIFVLDNEKYINRLYNILNNNKTIGNIFIDDNLINYDLGKIMLLANHQLYNYGNNGNYTKENIIINNNILRRTFKNNIPACLTTNKDINTLELCNYYDIHTYSTDILLNDPYNYIKMNLQKGKIFAIKVNELNLNELDSIIKLIKTKGINIVTLNKLIQE